MAWGAVIRIVNDVGPVLATTARRITDVSQIDALPVIASEFIFRTRWAIVRSNVGRLVISRVPRRV